MTSSNLSPKHPFATYPIGPQLRSWLGIADADYSGHLRESKPPTPDEEQAVSGYLLDFLADHPAATKAQFTDVLEELVGMHLPLVALKFADLNQDQLDHQDFRTQFQLGNAAMIAGDLGRAELCFRAAQELVPEEPAPYTNLAQIYYQDGRDSECETWCVAGLDASPNHPQLWEIYAALLQVLASTDGGGDRAAAQKLLKEAERRGSWAGLSLASDLLEADSPQIKLGYLETLYHQGLKDHDFLIELTAVMGAAGRFERIPPVIWAAEAASSTPLSWQLYFHNAQAHLAMGAATQAREALTKVEASKHLPEAAWQAIAAIKEELEQGLSSTESAAAQQLQEPIH